MDSRPVILLTKGYLNGWLSFDYPQPLSKLREDFILAEIEKQLITEAISLKTLSISSSISGLAPFNKKLLDHPLNMMERFNEMTLPYMFKKAKMEELNEDNIESIKLALQKAKEQFKVKS